MDFTAILEYQKIDDYLKKLKSYVASNEIYKRYNNIDEKVNKLQATYDNDCNELVKLENEFQQLLVEAKNIGIDLKETDEDLSKALDSYTSIEQMDQHDSKSLNKLEKNILDLDAKVKQINEKLKKISAGLPEVQEALEKNKIRLEETTAEYKKLKYAYKVKTEHYQARKKELIKDIDPQILSLYNKQFEQRKTDAQKKNMKIVSEMSETNIKTQYCSACYKHIGNTVDRLKNSGDWVECPECYSILFIK